MYAHITSPHLGEARIRVLGKTIMLRRGETIYASKKGIYSTLRGGIEGEVDREEIEEFTQDFAYIDDNLVIESGYIALRFSLGVHSNHFI